MLRIEFTISCKTVITQPTTKVLKFHKIQENIWCRKVANLNFKGF